jgi:hypothetical protein
VNANTASTAGIGNALDPPSEFGDDVDRLAADAEARVTDWHARNAGKFLGANAGKFLGANAGKFLGAVVDGPTRFDVWEIWQLPNGGHQRLRAFRDLSLTEAQDEVTHKNTHYLGKSFVAAFAVPQDSLPDLHPDVYAPPGVND